METAKELNNMKERVRNILRIDERARNSDKWLLYKIWREETNIYIPFQDFDKLSSSESVRRVRQKIQNEEHLFLPTEIKVRERRKVREEDFRKWSVDR